MATNQQHDSTSLIAEFLELAGLEPALIAEPAPHIAATGIWKLPLIFELTTWPWIDSDYRLPKNSPEFASQILRTRLFNDTDEVFLTHLSTPQLFIEVAEIVSKLNWDRESRRDKVRARSGDTTDLNRARSPTNRCGHDCPVIFELHSLTQDGSENARSADNSLTPHRTTRRCRSF